MAAGHILAIYMLMLLIFVIGVLVGDFNAKK